MPVPGTPVFIEANSTDPEIVSSVFKSVTENYSGLNGKYSLDEIGERRDFKVGLGKISLNDFVHVQELCGEYDVFKKKLETYSNFP